MVPLCVFQFIFNRRGIHPGDWSPARPMGGRQRDPASYRSKSVFVYVHVTMHLLSVCIVNVFMSVWERNSPFNQLLKWENPVLSGTGLAPSPIGGRGSSGQRCWSVPVSLSQLHLLISQLYEPTPSLSLPYVSIAAGTNKQSQKRQKEMFLLFIHLNVSRHLFVILFTTGKQQMYLHITKYQNKSKILSRLN